MTCLKFICRRFTAFCAVKDCGQCGNYLTEDNGMAITEMEHLAALMRKHNIVHARKEDLLALCKDYSREVIGQQEGWAKICRPMGIPRRC
jgi:hypothetical protein